MPGDLFLLPGRGHELPTRLDLARQAGIRSFLHSHKQTGQIGLAIENPEQTLPGSVVLPPFSSTGKALNLVSEDTGGQFDTNSGTPATLPLPTTGTPPTFTPMSFLGRTAFDAKPGGHAVHLTWQGSCESLRAVNLIDPTSTAGSTKIIHDPGRRDRCNIEPELVKTSGSLQQGSIAMLVAGTFASTAGPDVIVRPDGSLSGIRSGSGIGGIEYQPNPKQ